MRFCGNGKERIIILVTALSLLLSGCGSSNAKEHFEVIDGKIVKVTGDGDVILPGAGENGKDYSAATDGAGVVGDINYNVGNPESLIEQEGDLSLYAGSAELSTGAEITDGVSFAAMGQASENASVSTGTFERLRAILTTACEACRETYANAYKGETLNVTLSLSDISSMAAKVASAGYAVQDYNGQLNMQGYENFDAFCRSITVLEEDISEPYFTIYSDGHLSAFLLSRENGRWLLYSMSSAWNADGSWRIYSEGCYAVADVRYTEKGWLIYRRDITETSEGANDGDDMYVMVRVKPYDSEARTLCERYVKPVGYFENNLFTTNWSEADFGAIDFNSLYAYIFAMYNGTEMLSSYNARKYYKNAGNTKMSIVPADIFENNTGVYFRINGSVLKNISDYSNSLGGYFFLGYDRSYFNVTPKTPFPEVVSYSYNTDGTITMTVDAVNKWYGTDRAFRHELTVRPGNGSGFQYVSNTLLDSPDNIIPQQKLSEMLNVERTKTIY